MTIISLSISRKKWHQAIQLRIFFFSESITYQIGVFVSKVFGKDPIKSVNEIPDKLEYNARLARRCFGHFYLCISKRLDKYNGPLQKIMSFILIMGSEPFVLDMIQVVSSLN